MPKIKTAISIDKSLYDELEILRNQFHLRRSDLYVRALSHYLEMAKNKQLLRDINKAYGEGPSEDDNRYLQAAKKKYRDILEDEK